MYRPAQFAEDRPEVLRALIRAAPFAHLVLATEHGLEANGLPLLLREHDDGVTLVGHVARSNPIWRGEVRGEALAIFSGPQGYVTPSAYPTKRVDGKVVPTWNYVLVHAHGTLRWVHDDEWLARLVTQLTDEHEAGRPNPWQVTDAPAPFIASLRKAIVGFELTVTRLEGKLKLGQNRTRADREGVIDVLRAQGDEASAALAEAMRAALDE
ncbi:MAG TPA: FMN-binding negative transcriptional regulator [Polyangiaceae bacterium]|nr:FMN-binding negative transcriptional regulator [Polyangiaceae bacterium]